MRLFTQLIIIAIVFSLFISCTRNLENTNTATENRNVFNIPPDAFISLERTGCYGDCPSYFVAILADGTTIINPRDFYVEENGIITSKRGVPIKTQISLEQVSEILKLVDESKFFSLQENYQNVSTGCPGYVTDSSTAFTTVQINGQKKFIKHYLGCIYIGSDWNKTYPKELTDFENKIDEIVNIKQWLK